MASSSSAHEPPHRHLFPHGTTAAPPPTPSSQPTSDHSAAADALTSLLHRLPATLSLPTSRFSRRHTAREPKPAGPTVSLTQPRSETLSLVSATALGAGYFQLTDHGVTAQLAESAESESAAILALSLDQKRRLFPSNWPVGFDTEEEEDDENTTSFCVDGKSLTSADGLSMAGLTELTRELDRVGVEVVDMLTCALGLENPTRKCSLTWVSESDQGCKAGNRCYPYVVGLTYQIRKQEYRLDMDTGSVLVEPEIGSILVTFGDIAQVWSNGKTKKVRGTPILTTNDKSISMCLLVTLPLDVTLSPLLPLSCFANENKNKNEDEDKDEDQVSIEREKMIMKFNPIPFEDYAWRVFHERLFLKDTLDRHRI